MTLEPEDELIFIVGGDMAPGLPGWREPEAVLELAELGGRRARGRRRADVIDELSRPARRPRARDFFDMPRIDISSSLVRRRVAEGLPIRYLVPDAVARAIADARACTGDREAARTMTIAESRELADAHRRAAPPTRRRSTSSVSTCATSSATRTSSSSAPATPSARPRRSTTASTGDEEGDGLLPRRVEGLAEARWILMDYLDVVVHVFTPDARDYYRLEQLWGEAPRHAVGA